MHIKLTTWLDSLAWQNKWVCPPSKQVITRGWCCLMKWLIWIWYLTMMYHNIHWLIFINKAYDVFWRRFQEQFTSRGVKILRGAMDAIWLKTTVILRDCPRNTGGCMTFGLVSCHEFVDDMVKGKSDTEIRFWFWYLFEGKIMVIKLCWVAFLHGH